MMMTANDDDGAREGIEYVRIYACTHVRIYGCMDGWMDD